MAKKLTVPGIEKMRAGKGRREIPDTTQGLHLVIQESGVKSWAFRYRRPDGSSAKLTLGRHVEKPIERKDDEPLKIGQPLTLLEARELANAAMSKVKADRDPGAEYFRQREKNKADERAKQAAETVEADAMYPAMARRYVQRFAKANLRRWQATARDLGLNPTDPALPVIAGSFADRWRDRPAASIRRTDVVAEMDRAVDRGKGPTAGNHFLAAVRKMFRWHVKRGALEADPCAMIEMPAPLAKLRRTRRLSDDEVRVLWQALDDMPVVYAALVRILLLSGLRRDEARLGRWPEISADSWIVPTERSKNHLEFLCPLNAQAQAVIAAMPRIEGKAGYVFTLTGKTPISGMSKWKAKLDARMAEIAGKPIPAWQHHDFRRVMRSYLSRVASPDIAERCLNHAIGGVRAHYDLHSFEAEKRRALEAWGREVERIISGKPATVTPLPIRA
jgi:integrase